MATHVINPKDIGALNGRHYPGAWDLVGWLNEALRRLETWFEHQRRYRATVADLRALDDHILADIGLERRQIAEVAWRLSARSTPGR